MTILLHWTSRWFESEWDWLCLSVWLTEWKRVCWLLNSACESFPFTTKTEWIDFNPLWRPVSLVRFSLALAGWLHPPKCLHRQHLLLTSLWGKARRVASCLICFILFFVWLCFTFHTPCYSTLHSPAFITLRMPDCYITHIFCIVFLLLINFCFNVQFSHVSNFVASLLSHRM